jgi:transcriptional regulator with XRE-family HTH domain
MALKGGKRKLNVIGAVLKQHNKTQAWVAERLDVNVATVNRWANNQAQPSLENLFEVARHLKISAKDLLNDD